MHLFHLHSQKFDRILRSNFWMFETSVWLHTVGRSFIAVFIPILLLVSGFDLETVIWYYLVYYLIDIPINFLARKCTIKFGAKACIIIATFATIGFFLLLGQLSASSTWVHLGLLALLAGIYDAFYFVSHLFLFMEIEQEEKETKKGTGFLYAIRQFGTLLGPFIGALFLIFVSEDSLIFLSIFILFISIIPLFRLHDLDDKPKEIKPIRIRHLPKEQKRTFMIHMLWTVHRIAESTIWPIFIYITFESLQSVAAISMIASVTSIIFSYFSSKISDKKRYSMIILGALIVLLTWLARIVIDIPSFYYVSVVIVGFVTLFVSIPLDSKIFSIGSQTNPLNVSTLRNTASMVAGAVFFGLILALVNIFQSSFTIAVLAVFIVLVTITSLFKKTKKRIV